MARKICVEYDENIIAAIRKIKQPILGKDGHKFYIREKGRKQTGLEHIADKKHRLKVRDIESIENILKSPVSVRIDPYSRNYKNYYGLRKGDEKKSLLKIITWPDEHDEVFERIITIYPVKNIK